MRRRLAPPVGLLLCAVLCAVGAHLPSSRPLARPGGEGGHPCRDSVVALAESDTSFLAQYAATYRFRLGQPTAVRPTPDGNAVLFLRSGPRSFVQSLYEFDVASRRERVLLTAEQVLRGAEEKLSAEERARRERQRIATRGIVSYELSKDGKRILVPLGERLFVIERATGAVRELSGSSGFPLDPQLSPDGSMVACVRDGDLYVLDIASGRERRLTEGADDTLSHGLAEFVAQEEMGRHHGYWWSPDGASIAYQETNVAPVERLHMVDPAHPEKEPQTWRYPRAGRRNAEVRLGIVPVGGGATVWVRWDRRRYPYLAAVCWEENAPLTILVQNRRQTEELLLAVDPHDGSTRVLLIERDDAWLNLDQAMPHWLEDGSAFLWTSERGGGWQLELRRRDGRLLRAFTPPTFNYRGFVDVDPKAGVAWVLGGDDPTQQHVFRVALGALGGPPRQVTRGSKGWHDAVFSRNHRLWVHSATEAGGRSIGAPYQEVIDSTGRAVAVLSSQVENPLVRPHLAFAKVGARQYRAVIVRPQSVRLGRRYPVIVNVYGGPRASQVRRAPNSYLLDQWLANRGFVVVSIDGRGTPNRGRAWERAIRGNLIDVALDDQVEALQALADDYPELDLSRVGIFGWSFGGYFAAMATMRRPDVFRAGVAGAPVADWHDYDTHYTERYLDLPELNPAGYEASSVLTYAGQLERPLLVVHGTADDNVYFLHSMKLCDALFRAGKEFEFLPLPGFTHMVPDPVVTTRLYRRIAEFFERHVMPVEPPARDNR